MIEAAPAVVGYRAYIDLIRPLIRTDRIIQTGMTREVERASAAVDIALSGTDCAIVSSGDPGIYAMAGLVLEICRQRAIPIVARRDDESAQSARGESNAIVVEVVPGIPALCAGAALLGAPLTHDFAAVSLSDLLTPWETIETRLDAAARADFVIALYNPKSKKRHWQLGRARQIVLRHRPPETPVGIVGSAMRADQRVRVTTLDRMDGAEVDMQTTVFIGNARTEVYGDFMITPRGYKDKYDLAPGAASGADGGTATGTKDGTDGGTKGAPVRGAGEREPSA